MAEETKKEKTADDILIEEYTGWGSIKLAAVIGALLAIVLYYQEKKKK